MFSGSIEDNIAYGWRPENGILKFEDVFNAARQANALEFIESFPQGFSTLVGEKGKSLSGRWMSVWYVIRYGGKLYGSVMAQCMW